VITDVLEDHQNLIEEAVERGFSESDYISTLSTPKQIAKSLKNVEKRRESKDHKLVALSPFLAVIAFFLIGFGTGAWHPGWLVFLGIPIAGVLFDFEKEDEEYRIVALSPFIATIAFFLIGTYTPSIFGYQLTYVDAWLVFFIIPILGLLKDNSVIGRVSLGAFIVVPIVYFFLQLSNPSVYNLLIFLVLLVIGLLSGVVKISMDIRLGKWEEIRRRLGWIVASLILISLSYLVIGYYFSGWHPWWVIFLLLPMVILYFSQDEDRFKVVAYSPFLATIAFILVGHYFNAYQLSWLFFLAIPILGVLEER